MRDLDRTPALEAPERRPAHPATPGADQPKRSTGKGRGTSRARLLGLAVLLLLIGALALGVWRHYAQHRQAIATAEQRRDFVPSVRVQAVTSSGAVMHVALPGTTEAFDAANIFARASGYIAKRYVDIGSQVKAGDVLVEITAPELDHQIAQAEATLAQTQAQLRQTLANMELARVTNARTRVLTVEGWATKQQGDNDRLTYAAQQQAAQVAQSSIQAQQAQLKVLLQQKAYQQVVAPFDGVVTQRNVDIGSLVQADATSGTFLFAMKHSDVIRIQLYVPQDEAFGVEPGVDAVVRVPEMPRRSFPGKVTRIADALQPGTRTLLTEIDVPNPDGALTPGTYCAVELQVPRKTPSLIVPGDAVIFNQAGLHVAVVDTNGTVHMRKIAIVRDFGREVEVHDGVQNGDQVILNPPVDLEDGAKVRIRAAPAEARP
jgi:RND family efflux transporter MFP subunit